MNKIIKNYMDYYKRIEAQKIDKCISNLKDGSSLEMQNSALYLQNHSDELTDEQISNIVFIAKNDKVYFYASNYIDAILMYRKSKLIEDYYKYKILNDDENYLNINSALYYLMQPEFDQDFELYRYVLNKAANPQNAYLTFIQMSNFSNEKLVLDLLNSKDFVDLIYNKINKEQWQSLQTNVESNLIQKITVDKLKTTYFFNKVKS